jgi:hypothetical protein
MTTRPSGGHEHPRTGGGAVGCLQLSTDNIDLRRNKLAMKQLASLGGNVAGSPETRRSVLC